MLGEMRAAALAALAAPAGGASASCDEQPREQSDEQPRVAHASVFVWDHAQPTEGSRRDG